MNQLNQEYCQFKLFNYVPVGICVVNKDYDVIFWNNCLEHWTNIKNQDVIQKKIWDFIPLLQTPLYKNRIDILFDGGLPIILSAKLNKNLIPAINTNNIEKVFHTTINLIPGENPDEHLALFAIEDVTELSTRVTDYKRMRDQALDEIEERKKAETALLESEKQLRELNATKDRFFSIIAHDIKNPLAVFLNVSELIKTMFDELSKDELIYFTNEINKSAKNLMNLLDNLLTWARSQTGKLEFLPSNNDLFYICSNCISLLAFNAEKKGISLISNITEQTMFYGDPDMIDTVLRNLVINAIKFTSEGGTIKIDSIDIGNYYEISVTDNGVGISDDVIDKLFKIDSNVSTSGTMQEKGTGLGLILCKEFIEKNGGKIRAESQIGVGSKFKFTLRKSH